MIIYQDKDIVVCEKRYGVSSQRSDKENMISILEQECGCEIYPVHRLDIQTTGLIVYAKNQKSASVLSQGIQNGLFRKEYVCLCHGNIEESGEMVDLLYHDKVKNKSFVVKSKRTGCKEARLSFYKIDSKSQGEYAFSLVRVRLFTGRTHQIRVQFSHRGYVLYGDGKYGAKDNGRIALHSAYISFPHPTTGELVSFESERWKEIFPF